jgi:hypothetical protein
MKRSGSLPSSLDEGSEFSTELGGGRGQQIIKAIGAYVILIDSLVKLTGARFHNWLRFFWGSETPVGTWKEKRNQP